MKTEEQIVDEVYENAVFGLCSALIHRVNEHRQQEAEANFLSGITIARTARDRAKALLKEVAE